MIRLTADENLDNDIIRGVVRRNPDVDILRLQDTGLRGADDPAVLEWAAGEGRVLLTHDVATMTRFAYERVADGKQMPGIFEIGTDLPLVRVIEDVLMIAECSLDGEWEGQVRYLPLR